MAGRRGLLALVGLIAVLAILAQGCAGARLLLQADAVSTQDSDHENTDIPYGQWKKNETTTNDTSSGGSGNKNSGFSNVIDCRARVHANCSACYQIPDATGAVSLICRTCDTGYTVNSDSTCECAVGYYMNATTNNNCVSCPLGSICPGGTNPPVSCGEGLQTLISGGRSKEQCVTQPGYGYVKNRTFDSAGGEVLTVSAVPCALNYFSTGKSTLPCRPCPNGLITLATKTTTNKDCIAPAGAVYDKGIAKPCARGTYSSSAGNGRACSKCPTGLTTPSTGSTSLSQCYQAMPGYRVVTPAVKAEKCRRGSFNAGYNNATECVTCPENNMVTLNEAGKSNSSCVVPPGYGYDKNKATGQRVAACPIGWYKEGFNLKPCLSCGQGMLTNKTASESKANCMIPPGYGTKKVLRLNSNSFDMTDHQHEGPDSPDSDTGDSGSDDGSGGEDSGDSGDSTDSGNSGDSSDSASNGLAGESVAVSAGGAKAVSGAGAAGGVVVAAGTTAADNGTTYTDANGLVYDIVVVQCDNGTYGSSEALFGIVDMPCKPCGDYMSTMDQNPSYNQTMADAVINIGFDSCVTLPGYGWDVSTQSTTACKIGTYSEGWGLTGCYPCQEGYTTKEPGAENATLCLPAPGYFVDLIRSPNGPIRCDEGSYCEGLDVNATAVPCAPGTWSLPAAKKASDCDVCLDGYGSWSVNGSGVPSCTLCPVNTYGAKGNRDACTNCPSGQFSMAGSSSTADCYDEWQKLKKDFDYLPVVPGSGLLTELGSSYNSEDECKADCSGPSCVFYIYDKETKACSVYTAPVDGDATHRIGFKVQEGVYTVYNTTAAGSSIGVTLPITVDGASANSIITPSVEACTKKCDAVEGCVALLVTKTAEGNIQCALRAGALSVELRSRYKVSDGTSLNSWFPAAA